MVGRLTQEIGRYWRHSWMVGIDVEHVVQSQRRFVAGQVHYVHVYRPGGRVLTFRRNGSDWIAPSGVKDQLVDRIGEGGVHAGWTLNVHETGRVEVYNDVGDIVEMLEAGGSKLVWNRNVDGAGSITSITITDDKGRYLQMNYADARISSVVNSAGQTLPEYAYDAVGNLASVTYPDTRQKIYHYNEPAHTGGASLPHASLESRRGRHPFVRIERTGLAVRFRPNMWVALIVFR